MALPEADSKSGAVRTQSSAQLLITSESKSDAPRPRFLDSEIADHSLTLY